MSPADLWQKSHKNGDYERLFASIGSLPKFVSNDLCKIHAVENYRKVDGEHFTYMLFGFKTKDSKSLNYSGVTIPAQTYAIFPSDKFSWDQDFTSVLKNFQKRFYTEWLPTTHYEKVDGPNFEIYGGDTNKGYIELWYPVKKKI